MPSNHAREPGDLLSWLLHSSILLQLRSTIPRGLDRGRRRPRMRLKPSRQGLFLRLSLGIITARKEASGIALILDKPEGLIMCLFFWEGPSTTPARAMRRSIFVRPKICVSKRLRFPMMTIRTRKAMKESSQETILRKMTASMPIRCLSRHPTVTTKSSPMPGWSPLSI